MKRYTWLIVPLLISLYCCNSEKKVLRDPEKTQHVINAWLIKQPLKIDTTISYLPGDTVTTLVVAYDTTTVRDTVTQMVERQIVKTRTVTNTIHDTVKIKITDPRLLKACQDGLATNANALIKQTQDTEAQKILTGKWQLRFWSIVLVIGFIIAVIALLKYIKPKWL